MRGRVQARDHRHEERMELAWTIAALVRQGRKLQPLSDLLAPPPPIVAQTGDAMVAALRSLAAQPGIGMKFKLVKTRAELDAEIEAGLVVRPGSTPPVIE